MKVDLMGNCSLNGTHSGAYSMFGMTDDELFEYVDNHPDPELMGGKLADAFKRGRKKIKAKVQKVVKKAAAKYKKLPKWAKVVTGIVGAPAALGLAPAAIGAVAPAIAPALSVAKTTALTAAPIAIPALQAKRMKKRIDAARKKRLAEQQKIAAQQAAAPTPAIVEQPAVQEQPYTQPAYTQPAYNQPIYDDTSSNYRDNYQEPQTAQPEEKKGGIPGWLLGAAALIPFFL